MSIYNQSTLGWPDNQITFNDATKDPYYRILTRLPQKYQIRSQDVPVPFESGISDFLTLIGDTVYVLKGKMYPANENSFDSGRQALAAVSSLDLEQSDPYNVDEGYVPYVWGDALSSTNSKQLFVKVLYCNIPEDTRQGYAQPFDIICRIKDPTIYGYTLKTASTLNGTPVVQKTITNLVPNPSFETGTNGYTAYNSATLAQSNAQAYSGTYSASLTTTTGNNRGIASNLISGLTPSISYTFSAYVYAAAGVTINSEMDSYTTGGAFLAGAFGSIVGNGGWQRITTTITMGSTATQLQLYLYANANTTFYVDAVQLETGSVASSYFDGSFTSNLNNVYAWTGTANNSASTNAVYVTNGAAFPAALPVVFGSTSYSATSTASNIGKIASYPQAIYIYGPVTNPRITNSATGEYIQVNATLSSTSDVLYIQYDKDSFTLTKNGVNYAQYLATGSTLFKIHPGDNNITLSGSLSAGAYATVNFYDAWPLA